MTGQPHGPFIRRLRSWRRGRLTTERLARAMWDAREITDPSGERTGCTEDDLRRAPVYWDEAVAGNHWPGSRRDQIREAKLVLDLLANDR